jgi:hypothetical protein
MQTRLGAGLGPGFGTGLDAGIGAGRRGPEAPGAPRLIDAPRIAGSGRIGAALTLDPGVWDGAERLAVAWLKDSAPIPQAAGLSYVPTAADDRAALGAEVTAVGPGGGRVRARAAPITTAFAPPRAVASDQEFTYTQTTGLMTLDISPFFSGEALSFGVTGEGATLDPATGLVSFGAEALRAGVTLRVTARNSGGEAELGFTLRYAPAVSLPEATTAPGLSGAGRVGAPLVADPGDWTGEPAITLQWLREGAPIAGATGIEFVPGDADDGMRIACRATATNAAGSVSAETPAVRVVQVAPLVLTPLADRVLPVAEGVVEIAAAEAFAGRGLRFAVTGGGAAIDPATGVIAIPTGTARAAEPVTVTAANSGGAAETAFALRVLAAPGTQAAPAPAVFALGEGAAAIEAGSWFTGEDLSFALEAGPAGAMIDPASGRVSLPLAAALEGEIVVAARNVAGTAVQRQAVRAMAAPTALAQPAPVVFLQGSGEASLSTQAFFSGPELVFALEGAPAGITIQAGSGLVGLSTEALLAGEIVVAAVNAAGRAVQRIAVSVVATATDFTTPQAVAGLPFLYLAAAPTWSAQTAGGVGFGRLQSAVADRAHGDWALARGDGRYRALARWSQGATAMTQARPFGLVGRMRKVGGDFSGLYLYALAASATRRQLQVRGYTGSGLTGTILSTVDAPWSWDAWTWLEAEFDAGLLRARIYAEGAAAPAWQLSVAVAWREPGGFGPASQGLNGLSPIVDIRRLEYHPLAVAAPAAAQEADWSLGQTMVQS